MNEEICQKNPDKKHEPDWKTCHVEHDGDGVYIDVNCKHCGRLGCVGNAKRLAKDMSW